MYSETYGFYPDVLDPMKYELHTVAKLAKPLADLSEKDANMTVTLQIITCQVDAGETISKVGADFTVLKLRDWPEGDQYSIYELERTVELRKVVGEGQERIDYVTCALTFSSTSDVATGFLFLESDINKVFP